MNFKSRLRIVHRIFALLIPLLVSLRTPILASQPEPAELFPGETWLDTDGNAINAHGGGILLHKSVFYWYGEAKTGRTFLPDCNKSWGGTRVDVTGVSCYSSTNLTRWKNEGLVLAAVTNDFKSDLHCSKVIERPKVVFNRATQKFVMWMHVDSADYKAARSGVAVSETPRGPFKYLGSFRPNAGAWPLNVRDDDKKPTSENYLARDFEKGQMARDLTVFVDEDEKAYLFYSSEENATLHISALTDDYLRPAGKYSRAFIGRSMEAPAVFKRDGRYYLLASGCTAWIPNAARIAVADHIFGPWTELGNPCSGKDSKITFGCQGTFVMPNPNRNGEFIFMADRWQQWNLTDSRHVWLPLEFNESDHPSVRWYNQWSLGGKRTPR